MQNYMQSLAGTFSLLNCPAEFNYGDDWNFVSEDGTFRAFATIGGNVVHKDMDEELV
ncbi:MAG: hypothetical protein CM15mP81_16830 [Alphaproteobacteria bacterium]|nr:MAG: hypothetical protein CM15mP81_16830 [Alphaproteobacteria bacterium]